MRTSIILINPWIYDFAAYDLWSKPLGLLTIAARLRQAGLRIHLIDCLEVHHPLLREDRAFRRPVRSDFGTGKFWRARVPPPASLRGVPRSYNRYGFPPEVYEAALRHAGAPAAILVTSHMTYWYPGVQEAIRVAKGIYPGVPIILGGIYARLCEDHARRFSGADRVVTAPGAEAVLHVLGETGLAFTSEFPQVSRRPYPAFDLLHGPDPVCLTTSSGCPYRCPYCASAFLVPTFTQREPAEVLEEIIYWVDRYGVRDFAFYDDALLISAESRFLALLEGVARAKIQVRFHTPNAVHAREVTREIADLMRTTGFETIRLGFEVLDATRKRGLDFKVSEEEFIQAVRHLRTGGFEGGQIGAYVLMGLPGQAPDSVADAIRFVADAGAVPYLSEYSPIPHTGMWEQALRSSEYDLEGEPLFHNNTLIPCWDEGKKREVPRLKELALQFRRKGSGPSPRIG